MILQIQMTMARASMVLASNRQLKRPGLGQQNANSNWQNTRAEKQEKHDRGGASGGISRAAILHQKRAREPRKGRRFGSTLKMAELAVETRGPSWTADSVDAIRWTLTFEQYTFFGYCLISRHRTAPSRCIPIDAVLSFGFSPDFVPRSRSFCILLGLLGRFLGGLFDSSFPRLLLIEHLHTSNCGYHSLCFLSTSHLTPCILAGGGHHAATDCPIRIGQHRWHAYIGPIRGAAE